LFLKYRAFVFLDTNNFGAFGGDNSMGGGGGGGPPSRGGPSQRGNNRGGVSDEKIDC